MTIRLRCEYSQYRWAGVPTRYIDLVRYLDGGRYRTIMHGTSDLEADSQLPGWLNPHRDWLKCLIAQGSMPWYQLGDLQAEIEAMQSCKAQEFDVLHYMDGERCGQFMPRRVKEMNLAGIKTVATFHQPPQLLRKLVNEKMLRWLDAAILVSPSQLPVFQQWMPDDKLNVILLGVDAELFRPATEKNNGDRVVCITTGLHLRDWETFKKVAQEMPDVTFVVVTSRRVQFDDIPNLQLYTGISDAALADFYRSADILFLPLLDTTANNTLLEGIASGLPVVATDHVSVRAYVPNDEAILVPGNNVKGFVDAIRRLQNDPALRQKMGRQARARAEELSWPSIIKQYDAVYSRLHAGKISATSHVSRDSTSLPAAPARRRSSNLKECFETHSLAGTDQQLQDVGILGQALLDTGLIEEATATFDAFANCDPTRALGYDGLARVAATQWRWNDAVAAIDQCLALAPESAQPKLISMKAIYLAQTGEMPRAREIALAIRDHFEGLSTFARLVSLDSAEQAITSWKACAAQFPDHPEGYLGQAVELMTCGNFPAADSMIAHAIGVWPNLLAAKVLSARCATNAKDMNAARARWNLVISMGGHDDDLAAAYARFLGLVGDQATADAYASLHALAAPAAAEFFSEYHTASGDLTAAIKHAHVLSSLQRDVPSYLREAALCMREGSPESLATAEQILREALDEAPDSAAVKAELAEVLIRLGQDDEARQTLQAINPEDKRRQFDILRLWASLAERDDKPAVRYWKSTFLELGALAATKNFSPELENNRRAGLY